MPLLALVALIVGLHKVWQHVQPPLPTVVFKSADLDITLARRPGDYVRRLLPQAAPPAKGPKLVALTFDDGPYPIDTPALLAVLARERVHATFFVIGRDVEAFPGLARAVAVGGHELANHTETHPNLDLETEAAVTSELARGAAAIDDAIGPGTSSHRFMRPPHGRFTRDTLVAAARAGYDTIFWTDDPGDWRTVDAPTLVAHVTRFATAPEILLLHSGRRTTLAALPGMIERFREAGYSFVTVGELVGRVPHGELSRPAKAPLTLAHPS